MAKPKAEIRPEGLSLAFCHVWDNALATMKAQGSWDLNQRPLLDEYVFALVDAEVCRQEGERPSWDRASKRASALADQLALTARGRKAAGLAGDDDSEDDPLARFAGQDELTKRRAVRSGVA